MLKKRIYVHLLTTFSRLLRINDFILNKHQLGAILEKQSFKKLIFPQQQPRVPEKPDILGIRIIASL
ncbi:MAG: hypothetical protein ACKOQS_01980 [Dolichospermum sp.]